MNPVFHPPESCAYNLIDSEVGFDYGLNFRKSRSGPEEDLILRFLSKLTIKSEPGIQLTIFKEPWLESGSPDLVGVFWHLPTVEKWSCNRANLQRLDFRVLHQLAYWGEADATAIQELFGRRSSASLDRLQAASMVTVQHGKATVCPLHTVYAVRHIFAIEAKIRDWRNALRQAFLNRWFASSSHVLLPRMPSNGMPLLKHAVSASAFGARRSLSLHSSRRYPTNPFRTDRGCLMTGLGNIGRSPHPVLPPLI